MKEPLGPVEALELAMKKEIEAERLYQKLAADYPAAREILSFLANEEQKHQKLIREAVTRLTT